jgi:endonuclease/exonuclease/phosphatase family metal-dependent hydrolase
MHYTRDILWVTGELDGELVHVFVNHWPSRRGGEEASAPGRAIAAGVAKHVIDSLMAIDVNTKVVLMGDLNDDPVSPSMTEVIGSKGKKKR